jgi:hypothetical protein
VKPKDFVSHPIPDALAAAEGYPQVGARVAPTYVSRDRRMAHHGAVLYDADVGVAWQVVATGSGDFGDGDGLELVWLVVCESSVSRQCRYLGAEAWAPERGAWRDDTPAWQVLP